MHVWTGRFRSITARRRCSVLATPASTTLYNSPLHLYAPQRRSFLHDGRPANSPPIAMAIIEQGHSVASVFARGLLIGALHCGVPHCLHFVGALNLVINQYFVLAVFIACFISKPLIYRFFPFAVLHLYMAFITSMLFLPI